MESNLILIIGITLAVTLIGGGIGYFLWIKTRPIKQTWRARVYRLSQGKRFPKNHKRLLQKGYKHHANIRLHDLIPYSKDVIEKIYRGKGKDEVFRLQKLKKTTQGVEPDIVELWGDEKVVHVLYHKDTCTLLRKGYNRAMGEVMFEPLPHSQINMIKSEIIERQSRLTKEKDILQAITPWVIAGILMLGMVAIAYTLMSGYLEIDKRMTERWEQSIGTTPAQPINAPGQATNLGVQSNTKPG